MQGIPPHAEEAPAMEHTAVSRWFGLQFASLHPLLQALHREGGRLHGPVDVHVGRGLAGVAGRALARRLGVPADGLAHRLEVNIRHAGQALHWDRRFDGTHEMPSTFLAQGQWPTGHWIEKTGPLRLALTVDVVDGAWQWRPLRLWLHGLRLPLWLFPRSRAAKRVEGGRYRFEVQFSLPGLGTILRYGGLLEAEL
jgi:hypothetical protein